MDSARAWVFDRAGVAQRLERVPLPSSVGPGEVLVAITAATLCGSDLHTIEGKRVDPAAPLVLGHEGVGRILLVGAGGSGGLQVGDRVTWGVATSCGACDPCSAWDLPQKCLRCRKFGHAAWAAGADGVPPTSGLAGTYASHILLTAGAAVLRVPEAVEDRIAAPINCALATMVNAVMNSPLVSGAEAGVARLRSVLIQGAGMLGLYGCALLMHGLGRPSTEPSPFVAVTDVSLQRLALARRFGASAVVDASPARGDDAVLAELHAALAASHPSAPTGFDLVIEVCGSSAVVPMGLRALRPGGEYVLVGQVHPASSLAGVTGEAIIRKCARLRGVHNYSPRDLAYAVDFLASTVHALPYAELCSPALPLEELPAAIELARTGEWARVCIAPGL